MKVRLADLLKEIDEKLRQEGVDIPWRPFHAWGRVCRRLGVSLDADHPISEEIQNWFAEVYGDRLKAPTLLGRIPIEMRGDIHVISMSPKIELTKDGTAKPSFDWGLDGGPKLFETLGETEKREIHDLLQMGWGVFSELAPYVSERALPMEATADLEVSLEQLTRKDGASLGLSKWASLQTAEKSLKAYLNSKGQAPPRTHSIQRLHALAVAQDFPDLQGIRMAEGVLLELIECSAGVRYGDEPVTRREAIGAHYSALMIATTAAAKMRLAAGGRNWLSLEGDSPAFFCVRRMLDDGGVPHKIDEKQVARNS